MGLFEITCLSIEETHPSRDHPTSLRPRELFYIPWGRSKRLALLTNGRWLWMPPTSKSRFCLRRQWKPLVYYVNWIKIMLFCSHILGLIPFPSRNFPGIFLQSLFFIKMSSETNEKPADQTREASRMCYSFMISRKDSFTLILQIGEGFQATNEPRGIRI